MTESETHYVLRVYVGALATLALVLAVVLVPLELELVSPWTVLALAVVQRSRSAGSVRLSETTEISIALYRHSSRPCSSGRSLADWSTRRRCWATQNSSATRPANVRRA